MMRRFFAAALAASLALSVVPTLAQAAPAVDAAKTQLLLKKKKLAAQMKALQDQQAALDKSLAAQAPKKVAKPKATALATASITPVKPKKVKTLVVPPPTKVTASFGKFQNSGLSGNTSNQVVAWNETKYPVGSLIVRTPERALYFVSGKGEAIRYSVGVGREGMQWSGQSKIVAKAEWPSWTPPVEMIKREAEKGHMLPPFMEGGPGNPLGARALYIGGRIYRVHGTNNEASIGGAVSSGCIRMMNADVIDLYGRVKIGAKIFVYQ
jgi:lipoprotein-anchoring transpeptidase ErfK/SrfK